MSDRYKDFNIAELQHLYVGLTLADKFAFRDSPIIEEMIKECGDALDSAVKKEED